jgi:hypothetical protein
MSGLIFTVERTAAGDQFVIPGTETRTERAKGKTQRPQFAAEGDQFVIPGTEQIAVRKYYERLAQMPLVPKRGQRSINGSPLFSSKFDCGDGS